MILSLLSIQKYICRIEWLCNCRHAFCWSLKLNVFYRFVLDNSHSACKWLGMVSYVHNELDCPSQCAKSHRDFCFSLSLSLHPLYLPITIFCFWIHFHFSRAWAKYISLNQLQEHTKCKLFTRKTNKRAKLAFAWRLLLSEIHCNNLLSS